MSRDQREHERLMNRCYDDYLSTLGVLRRYAESDCGLTNKRVSKRDRRLFQGTKFRIFKLWRFEIYFRVEPDWNYIPPLDLESLLPTSGPASSVRNDLLAGLR